MKKKITFTSIVAALIVAAMYFYHDQMELKDLILAIIGAGSSLGFVWTWFSKEEEKAKRTNLQTDFEQITGMRYNEFKDNKNHGR